MFKVNNARRRSGAFIVNFEHFSHLVLVFLLLTLNMQLPAYLILKGIVLIYARHLYYSSTVLYFQIFVL